jgi:hypothetical protein
VQPPTFEPIGPSTQVEAQINLPFALAHSFLSESLGDPDNLRPQMGVVVFLQTKLTLHALPLLGQSSRNLSSPAQHGLLLSPVVSPSLRQVEVCFSQVENFEAVHPVATAQAAAVCSCLAKPAQQILLAVTVLPSLTQLIFFCSIVCTSLCICVCRSKIIFWSCSMLKPL